MVWTWLSHKAKTEALYWVRSKLGLTDQSRPWPEDEEIEAALIDRGLTATSSPTTDIVALHRAAADVARSVAGRLGLDGEVSVPEVGSPKLVAAEFFLKLAKTLDERAEDEDAHDEPVDEIDRVDIAISQHGVDRTEYVGDEI